jgi:tmRNA-binding protein
MTVSARSQSRRKKILLNKEPLGKQTERFGRGNYVRTVMRIYVQTRRVVITLSRGDETLVVVIPI